MSEHSLPEDYSRWPADPFELLGVERGGDPKDLKRAYTRLIKVYKPEHHPEQFRRIREAYESALRFNEFFGRFQLGNASEEPADVPEIRPAEEAGEPVPRPPTPAPIIDEVTELWGRAIRGEEAEAYRGLSRLHETRPHQSAIALRLYWLLSLDPQLDPDKLPCDWLATGLRSCGSHPSLLELYRREIEADPLEADSKRFTELLGFEGMRRSLPELYSWRFRALRKLQRLDLLNDDLPIARERLFGHDESAWLHLLLLACDAAAWMMDDEYPQGLWEKLYREVQARSHLARNQGELFDRLDFLVVVREGWLKLGQLSGIQASFLDLIADSWNAPYPEYRLSLIKVLNEIDHSASKWLRYFDNAVTATGPTLLGLFAEVLQQCVNRLENPLPRPSKRAIERLIIPFLNCLYADIENYRLRAIEYCGREGIDLEWLVEVWGNPTEWPDQIDPERLFQTFANDLPVRLLTKARRLFWS